VRGSLAALDNHVSHKNGKVCFQTQPKRRRR
jgi:hypothetical protein